MATYNTTPKRDHLTLKERVDLVEGDYSLDESEDDLDMIPGSTAKGVVAGVSFDEYFDTPGEGKDDIIEVSSEGGDDMYADSGKDKERKPKGERVAFTDDGDSDVVIQQFKKRKTVQRKKDAAERAQVKKRVEKNSMVGRVPKLATKRQRERHYGDESDDDTALLETTLPDYLQARHAEWKLKLTQLKDRGLQVPPDYDGVYFSDEERLATVKERPAIAEDMQPSRKFEDIHLPTCASRIPAPIAQFLRDYQVDGVRFLNEKFVHQQGGILGDDMGLGKTIQVIAFLTAAFGKTGDERDWKRMRKMRRMRDNRWYPRVLLVVPGGLMANWRKELEKWGYWHTYTYHGGRKEREAAIGAAESGRLEIMITTYDTYRRYASEVNIIRWDCVIADECHKIKEKTSAITQEMNDVNAMCRIGLTGTAIQNKYEELWTLLNWTNPGVFGNLTSWKRLICVPLKLGQSHDATYQQLAKARSTAQKLVHKVLPQYLIRRTKALIADQLPKKSDRVVFCPLTETQTEAYDNFGDCEIVRYIRESADPCDCGSGKKAGWCCYTEVEGVKWQHFVFPALTLYQKIANHVALLLPDNDVGEKHDKELEKLQMAMPHMWKELYQKRDSIMNYANQNFCGKWGILKRLLKLWHNNGDKVLVFSYSVRLLRMLHMLFRTTTSYNVSYLDGSTPLAERQDIVDDFNSNPMQFVFLISTKAGGLGLNITSANKVVVIDPNWNPSYDLQAQDRAYRIGQTRDVEVFRLVSAGTMEEIVYARQVYKQQQANIGYNASVERRYFKGVQDQKELKGEIFGLANLFAPASESVKLRDIFNKTNIAESKAGVTIAGLDLEASQDDDDSEQLYEEREDAGLTQLAEEIIDDPAARRRKAKQSAKKVDPVQAVLAGAGVTYTHENAEVIGTSKIETRISSRAQKAGNDIDWNKERAFAQSQIDGADSVGDGREVRGAESGDDEEEGVRYRYQPAEDVRKRQFCEMARMFKYEDISEFALVVEGWTQEERRRCLERFYADRRNMLA